MRNKHEQQWRTLKNLLWAINQTWNGVWQLQRQVTGITLLDWNNKIISNVTDFFHDYILKNYTKNCHGWGRNLWIAAQIDAVKHAITMNLTVGEFNEYSDEIWTEIQSTRLPPQQRKGETRDNKDQLVIGKRNHSNRNKIRYPRKKRKTAWKRFYKLFPHLKPESQNT
jgi:hypothetical protein